VSFERSPTSKKGGANDPLREWEPKHHQTTNPKRGRWEGHCSWIAVASVLFEQPTKKHAGNFDYRPDDLELLAGEFAGVFAHIHELPDAFRMTQYPIGGSDLGILDILKPEEDNDDKELKTQLDQTFAGFEGTKDDFKERFQRDYGADPRRVKKEFGLKAAQFFQALQYELRGGWGAYVGDFRAGTSQGTALEVWTHALFMYSAEFVESNPVTNDRRYDVSCTLYCNRDVVPPSSSGAPARVRGNAIEPVLADCLSFEHKYQLSFDDWGEVVSDGSDDNKRPVWLECRNWMGGKLFAPRYLKQVIPPLKTIDSELQKRRNVNIGLNTATPSPGLYGNPVATWGLIERGLLRLRSRYK
jgi:hypothetical protein